MADTLTLKAEGACSKCGAVFVSERVEPRELVQTQSQNLIFCILVHELWSMEAMRDACKCIPRGIRLQQKIRDAEAEVDFLSSMIAGYHYRGEEVPEELSKESIVVSELLHSLRDEWEEGI